MSMLAQECAGQTRTRVTDREQAYRWLFGLMTEELGGEYLPSIEPSLLAETYDRLVTVSVRIINAERVSMSRLIKMRERELSDSRSDLPAFRRAYLAKIDAHVKEILTPGYDADDRKELERQFESAMREDLRLLKSELRIAAKDVLFSAEIGVCAIAVAGAALSPVALPAAVESIGSLGVGALFSTHNKYRKARGEALRKRASSWLYTAASSYPMI